MFKLRNLDVGYPQNLLISRANITFEKSKIYSIIGDNGTGKSTLMKTLNGFHNPLDGSLYFEEKNIKSLNFQTRAEIFSTLFSRHEIDTFIKVSEIFEFSISFNSKISLKDDLSQKIIKELGVSHLLDHSFSELSDGQKQLVLIARTFLKRTKIIFLDEPTIYLDIKTKNIFSEFLKKYAQEYEALVVLISHDMSFIKEVSSFIYEITDGTLKLATDIIK